MSRPPKRPRKKHEPLPSSCVPVDLPGLGRRTIIFIGGPHPPVASGPHEPSAPAAGDTAPKPKKRRKRPGRVRPDGKAP